MRRHRITLLLAAIGTAICGQARAEGGFQLSYAAGSVDSAGRFVGGTEVRILTAHGGRLYAGNGYWQDRPGPEGAQGAQILVLDRPEGRWRVDHGFDERLPTGRPRDLAVSALSEIRFETDGTGTRLRNPVLLLVTSTWDLSGATRVFTRDDATGMWAGATLAEDRPMPGFLPQIRSFGLHRDRRTGIDLAFAGQDPRGIYSGPYDAGAPGRIRWGIAPELELSSVASGAPGLAGRLRISSFAECNGRLFGAVGQQVFERIDGSEPRWRLVYTNPRPGYSETGLRGLTAIASPSGAGEVLLAMVEGDAARIIRIDPQDGSEATELDLAAFLGRAWQTRTGYAIGAYNDMTTVRASLVGDVLLAGLEVFIPPRSPVPVGHRVVDVGYGRLDAGGWYLVRRSGGRYDLRQITPAANPERPLVATRTISVSPFPNDAGALYFGGYDANKAPAHNTAWVFRADPAAALGEVR